VKLVFLFGQFVLVTIKKLQTETELSMKRDVAESKENTRNVIFKQEFFLQRCVAVGNHVACPASCIGTTDAIRYAISSWGTFREFSSLK